MEREAQPQAGTIQRGPRPTRSRSCAGMSRDPGRSRIVPSAARGTRSEPRTAATPGSSGPPSVVRATSAATAAYPVAKPGTIPTRTRWLHSAAGVRDRWPVTSREAPRRASAMKPRVSRTGVRETTMPSPPTDCPWARYQTALATETAENQPRLLSGAATQPTRAGRRQTPHVARAARAPARKAGKAAEARLRVGVEDAAEVTPVLMMKTSSVAPAPAASVHAVQARIRRRTHPRTMYPRVKDDARIHRTGG